MKRILLVMTVALVMAAMMVAMAVPAFATITLENPAGNTPQSDSAANGEAVDYVNPAGNAPPGWNP